VLLVKTWIYKNPGSAKLSMVNEVFLPK